MQAKVRFHNSQLIIIISIHPSILVPLIKCIHSSSGRKKFFIWAELFTLFGSSFYTMLFKTLWMLLSFFLLSFFTASSMVHFFSLKIDEKRAVNSFNLSIYSLIWFCFKLKAKNLPLIFWLVKWWKVRSSLYDDPLKSLFLLFITASASIPFLLFLQFYLEIHKTIFKSILNSNSEREEKVFK